MDGMGAAARFRSVNDIAIDSQGNLFVADSGNHVIRKVTPEGLVSTYAGVPAEPGNEDGDRLEARFSSPTRVAVGPDDTLYIVDGQASRVSAIGSDGKVVTLWNPGDGFLRGPEGGYQVYDFNRILVDSAGNLIASDLYYYRVYSINSNFQATLIRDPSLDLVCSGFEQEQSFLSPRALALDKDGNLFVGDSNIVRKVDTLGTFSDYAGSLGIEAAIDGKGASLVVGGPNDIDVDDEGNVYIIEHQNRIVRKITPNGENLVLAGRPMVRGCRNGDGKEARFNNLRALDVTKAGTVYVAGPSYIRKIDPEGNVSQFSGSTTFSGFADGDSPYFYEIGGIASDDEENLYVADTNNHVVRKVDNTGVATTIAGIPTESGYVDGPATEAMFWQPKAIERDSVGNLYVLDGPGSLRLRRIDSQGNVSTIATIPRNVVKGNERYTQANDLVFDELNSLFYIVENEFYLKRVTLDGEVSIIGGNHPHLIDDFSSDGVGEDAYFFWMHAIAMGQNGELFIAEDIPGVGRGRIRRGDPVVGAYPQFVANPADLVVEVGGSGAFSVEASFGGEIAYQWQRRPHGTYDCHDVQADETYSGSTSATLALTDVNEVNDRDLFRCIVTSSSASNISEEAELSVIRTKLEFTDSVQDQYTTSGYHCVFNVYVESVPSEVAGYWEVSRDEGVSWEALEESETYKNVNAANLVVTANPEMNGYLFRSVINNGWFPELRSSPARLTVDGGSPYDFKTIAWIRYGDSFHSPAHWYGGLGFEHKRMAVGSGGAVFLCTDDYHSILRIDPGEPKRLGSYISEAPNGLVTVFAGSTNESGFADGNGSSARFDQPSDIDMRESGELIIADTGNAVIRSIDRHGNVNTIAGIAGDRGVEDGPVAEARFLEPSAVAVAPNGDIFVADGVAIRKIGTDGIVSTIAGQVSKQGSEDGLAEDARFNTVTSIDVDRHGNVYILDLQRLRMLTPGGEVVTVAGHEYERGYRDGPGEIARFSNPQHLAVDESGNVYIADAQYDIIRKVDPNGVVTTLAGLFDQYGVYVGDTPSYGHYEDGLNAELRLCRPSSIAVDPDGNLYVASAKDPAIRIGSPLGIVVNQQPKKLISARRESDITITTESLGPNPLNFVWQISSDGGETWSAIEAEGYFSGVDTPSLQIIAAPQELSGSRLRCLVTDGIQSPAFTPYSDLVVREPNRLENWRLEHFGIYDSAGEALDTLDYDGDGLANLLEFVFSSNPKVSSSRGGASLSGDSSAWVYKFDPPNEEDGVSYVIEKNSALDPDTWVPVHPLKSDGELLYSVPIEDGKRVFSRIKAESR